MNDLFTLQFLRPYWLLALLPIAWLLWKIWQIKQKQGAWHQVIAPQFRPLLLGENTTDHTSGDKLNVIGLSLIWLIVIIALAGPSTQSVEMPAQKNQQGTVIILDLSLSMLADDLSPNRLARVKFKITDLLTQHPELSIGLVGYAGSAHTISPISEDNQTLLSLLPSLNPVLMPHYGADPLPGFQKADELFKGAHINHGHIIWITDDIESNQISQLKQWINHHDYSVSLLTVGTQRGGAVHIPNYGLLKDESGKIISPPLPLERFNTFAELNKVTLSHLTISQQSLSPLLPPSLASLSRVEMKDKTDARLVVSLDQGIYLLLLLIPLVALLFRRGWILSLSVISLPLVGLLSASLISLGLFMPNTSYAEDGLPSLGEVFKSPDQQAYQAWQENNLKAAESLFENEQWRASTLYKLGKHQEAAELFRQDTSPTGFYNLGNALAKNGQLEEAKQAYEEALKQQPDFTNAQQNLKIVNQLLAQQKAEQETQQEQKEGGEKGQEKQQQQQNQNQETQSEEPSEPDSSEQQSEQNQEDNKEGSNSESESESPNPESDSNNPSEKSAEEGSKNNAEHNTDAKSENASQSESTSESDTTENQPNNPSNSGLENEAIPQAPAEKNDKSDSEHNNDSVQDSESSEAHQEQAERNQGTLGDKINEPPKTSPDTKTLSQTEKEQQQATQNWLKQIPDDPGLFLKRKFEYQYQQQSSQPESTQGSKQW